MMANTNYLAVELTMYDIALACPAARPVTDEWARRNMPTAIKAAIAIIVWFPLAGALDSAGTAATVAQLIILWPQTIASVTKSIKTAKAKGTFNCATEINKVKTGLYDLDFLYPGMAPRLNTMLAIFPKPVLDGAAELITTVGLGLGTKASVPTAPTDQSSSTRSTATSTTPPTPATTPTPITPTTTPSPATIPTTTTTPITTTPGTTLGIPSMKKPIPLTPAAKPITAPTSTNPAI